VHRLWEALRAAILLGSRPGRVLPTGGGVQGRADRRRLRSTSGDAAALPRQIRREKNLEKIKAKLESEATTPAKLTKTVYNSETRENETVPMFARCRPRYCLQLIQRFTVMRAGSAMRTKKRRYGISSSRERRMTGLGDRNTTLGGEPGLRAPCGECRQLRRARRLEEQKAAMASTLDPECTFKPRLNRAALVGARARPHCACVD
jgi:hypothetical protein